MMYINKATTKLITLTEFEQEKRVQENFLDFVGFDDLFLGKQEKLLDH